MTIALRCDKEYTIRGQEYHRCVKPYGYEGECQLTLWWSLKVPPLEINIGTSIDGGEISIRRTK